MTPIQMIAVIIPIMLTVYLFITDYVDLHPYNDVSKHTPEVRRWESVNYILPIAAALLSWHGQLISNIIAFLVAAIYLYGHIRAWWIPYFFGCSENQKKYLEEHFGRTIKILPKIADHPTPNLEHLPVGLLIIIWFISALLMLIK